MAFAAPSGPAYYRAWARSPRLYGGAFSALAGVELKGNKVMVDSFNSGDPNYSTDGHYDPGKRKAGGDIYCQAGAVNIDDAFVYGKITTDPSTSLSIGQNGRVGDLNWAGPGIQPCWYAVHRFDLSWPEVTPPFSGGFPIPYNSASNTFYLGSGNYSTNGDFSLGNNQTLYVAGVVNLYVVGNFSIAAPGCALMIAPGATLHLYVGTVDGPGVTTRLTHVVNSGYGFSFLYYGLPSNTSLQLSFDSGGSYIGTVYAPETALDINVTGNTAVDFEGACVVRSVTASGPLNIHYDENLRRNGSTR